MRKMLLGCTTALFILGGCTTTQVTTFLGQVQADAASACLFVPTIDTILAVAAELGFSPAMAAAAAVNSVTSAICSQVPPPSSARYGTLAPLKAGGPASTVGTVGGVVVNGWRTK
jgi:hypothetical protein